ncbi:MAG TPA: nuclear transport factor 2 family protein [Pyrinomonadaceae bacterium]
MKRCPTCHKTFAEEHLTFCTEDGTPLARVDGFEAEPPADETTRVRPSPSSDEVSSWETPGSSSSSYQPPGSYLPPGSASQNSPKGRTWPWVVGVLAIILLAIAGVGIAAAMLVRNIARQNANAERRNENVSVNRGNSNSAANSNSSSSNWNENSDNNSNADDTTPPPTDSEQVLADLKRLEEEWTVANIDADKKKLNRILADDYVGIDEGRPQGKAQYLKTIEPDTAIQHWEFENLKLNLSGERATLTGVLRLDVKDENGQPQQLTLRFTDKFVWRDGRWQAIGSEVDPVPVKPGTAV